MENHTSSHSLKLYQVQFQFHKSYENILAKNYTKKLGKKRIVQSVSSKNLILCYTNYSVFKKIQKYFQIPTDTLKEEDRISFDYVNLFYLFHFTHVT